EGKRMTEKEWMTCSDPERMISAWWCGRGGGRKLRLFAVACVGRFRHMLSDPRCKTVIEASEQYAEGLVSEDYLLRAVEAAHPVQDAAEEARCAAWEAYNATGAVDQAAYEAAVSLETAAQV